MSDSPVSYRGMVVSPHYLASEAGLAVLRDGGNAVEAAIATVAALCVVYPHMTGLGGDAFWTIYDPTSGQVQCIDASGISGAAADFSLLEKARLEKLPQRGAQSIITCPGAVSGWQKALEAASGWSSKPLPLARLFEEAIFHAEHGYPVSAGQAAMISDKLGELKEQPGFSGQFLHDGKAPEPGARQTLPALARTLRRLAKEGLDGFYRGAQGRSIAAELAAIGAPITEDDLRAQHALLQQPLEARVNGITAREAQRLREMSTASGKAHGADYFQGLPIMSGGESRIGGARIFNCPPPSQGVSSLLILGIYDALANGKPAKDEFELVHRIAECTKLAFKLRDSHLADPAHMRESVQAWLESGFMARLAGKIDPQHAMPWGTPEASGDTVWFGVIDQAGRTVSCIQSIYFEFGTGVVLPDSGITWHNRGLGFSLDPSHPNKLGPRKRPFHTLNPALALFDDGRVMPYGTMGGEGQPQTQAAVFSRYAWQGLNLEDAISAPRWLLGRSWGEASASLKLEADFGSELIEAMRQAGHMVEQVPAQNSLMGHAGALVLHNGHEDPRRGQIQGAADPRSDGLAACW